MFPGHQTECTSCGPRAAFGFLGKIPGCDRLWLWEAAWRCSNKALRRYQRECGGKVSRDFKAGFRRAYWDILRGRTSKVPPVPPKKYWSAYYRAPSGRNQAEQWLEGYRTGAEYARSDGLDQFGRVASAATVGGAEWPSHHPAGLETVEGGVIPEGSHPDGGPVFFDPLSGGSATMPESPTIFAPPVQPPSGTPPQFAAPVHGPNCNCHRSPQPPVGLEGHSGRRPAAPPAGAGWSNPLPPAPAQPSLGSGVSQRLPGSQARNLSAY
ncbi:MAG: hypothetical protein GXP27_12250 [Planctomycetes bacterium]|nr:hypothetical protein [Planctomycetota bacterium]